MSMTSEQLVEQLKEAMPNGLRSVVLYGSAAAGDSIPGKSDCNVLVVTDRLGSVELEALTKPAAAWGRAGNRPPVLFTATELSSSADTFPIEFSDMRQSRKVLFGDDVLAGVKVHPESLRLQLERELKVKLLRLRERYLLTEGEPRRVLELMTASLSNFLVLFRAALRIYQDDVPARKLDAMRALAVHVGFEPKVFITLQELKEKSAKAGDATAGDLFAEYLKAIERVVADVDRRIHQKP